MDKATVEAIKELLINNLAQTENKVLNEIQTVKAVMNSRFNQTDDRLSRIEVDVRQVKNALYQDISDVASEMNNDKQELQQRLDRLQDEIRELQKRLSAM